MKSPSKRSRTTIAPREPDAESIRERILGGTYACIDRMGLTRTSIQDIATEAGVSRPTVYKYAGNKDKIIEEISDLESIKVKSEVRARLKRTDNFEETLAHALTLIVEITHRNRYLSQVMETIEFPAMALQPGSAYMERQKVWWGSLIRDALQSGEIASDLSHDDVIHWLTSSLHLLLVKESTATPLPADRLRFIRRFIVRPLITDQVKIR